MSYDDDDDDDDDALDSEDGDGPSDIEVTTARVVDELTGAAMLFTALDVSNAVKRSLPGVRHREVSPIVRDLFTRKAMGSYIQTEIEVLAGGTKKVTALLYHLPEHSADQYDDTMRNQVATPPTRQSLGYDNPVVTATAQGSPVPIGKDGRARVPRQLLQNAGIDGDRVLVQTGGDSLRIVAAGSTKVTQVSDPLFPMPDLFFTPTDLGQPINLEHPVLLHLPRSMVEKYSGASLVAKIDGASVLISRAN
jgi:hypothetical protein